MQRNLIVKASVGDPNYSGQNALKNPEKEDVTGECDQKPMFNT